MHNSRSREVAHLVPLALEVKTYYSDDELATRCRRCNAAKGASSGSFF